MTTRIQRRRVKDWRAPEGAIYIGYNTPWGNPFKWRELPGGKQEAQDKYRAWLPGAIARGEIYLEPLRDKVIMCYCAPGEPCHGDIIVEYLNIVNRII